MDENTQTQNRTALRRPVRQIVQEEEKRERIPTWMAIAMVVVALCIDVFTIIPIIGSGVAVAAYAGFFIWFKLRGVVFTKNFKNLAAFGGSAIIEFFLSFLPSFTAGILAVILFTKAEDRGGLLGKAASVAQGKINS